MVKIPTLSNDEPVDELAGLHLPVPDQPPEPVDPEPLMLDVDAIPQPVAAADMDEITFDDMTPEAKKLFRGSEVVASEMLFMAPKERQEEYRRLILGNMDSAERLSLPVPDPMEAIGETAAKAGMTADEAAYWQEHDPKYLESQTVNNQVLQIAGPDGYITHQLQDSDNAQKLRADAVSLAHMQADYLAAFGGIADQVRYDLGVGFGNMGVMAAKGVSGFTQMVSDVAAVDWNLTGRPEERDAELIATSRANMQSILQATQNYAMDAEAQWLGPQIDTGNPITDWVRTAIFQGTPSMVTAMGVSLIPGVGTVGSAAIFGTLSGFGTLGDLRAAGVDPLKSAIAAGGVAVSHTALELFQLNRIRRNLLGRSPFRRFSVGATIESFEEALAEAGQGVSQGVIEATTQLIGAPGFTRDQWWRKFDESLSGAFHEGSAAAMLSMATHFLGLPNTVKAQARASVFNNRFKKTVNTIGDMALYKSGQDAVIAEHLNQTAKHHGGAGIVFSSVQDLQQTGLTKAQLVEGLGVSEAEYDYARDNNVDLAIPYGHAAVFAKRQADAGNDLFQNILRADPDAMTGREIVEQEKEMTAVLEQAEVNFKVMEDANNASIPERIKIFRAGLRASGFDANEADATASLYWSRAQRASEMWGETPEAWLERQDVQLEIDTIVRNNRAMNQYLGMIEQGRLRRDAAGGYVSPDVNVAESTGQDIFAGSPAGGITEAAQVDLQGNAELAQPAVSPMVQPVAGEADNQVWVQESTANIMRELGLDGEQFAPLADAIGGALREGIGNPDVRAIAERLGVSLPQPATLVATQTFNAAQEIHEQIDPTPPSLIEELYQDGAATGEEALQRDVAAWDGTVDQFINGELPTRQPVTMLRQTPLVLQMLGAKNLPVTTSYNILKKIIVDKHQLSPETVKQIPAALADPIMVFRSATHGGDLVVMLDLKDENGATIVVPVGLEQEGKDGYSVNFVFSAYGKMHEGRNAASNEWFVEQMRQRMLLYRNMKKSRDWARAAGLQLPGNNTPAHGSHKWARAARLQLPGNNASNHSNFTIRTETDLVKLRTNNPTLYQNSDLNSPRGAIRFQPEADAPTIIRIFQNADVSTVVHELNHLFVRDLQNMVAAGRGGERARADLAALTAFAGGKLDRAGYERIAEAWERYAMDGRAPSPELYDAFDTFRDYIGRVYQNATQQLSVEPSAEVRSVFDRWLATDAQIAEARELQDQAGYWFDAVQDIDDAAKERLRVLNRRTDSAKRRDQDVARGGGKALSRVGKNNLADIRARIRGEEANTPAYRAISRAKQNGGFNRAEVEAMIGAPGAAEIAARHGEDIYGDGVVGGHADLAYVADVSGYQTIEEMLSDISGVPSVEAKVTAAIESEMTVEGEMDAKRDENEGDGIMEEAADIEEEGLVAQVEESVRATAGERGLREFRLKYQAMKIAARQLVGSKALREAVDLRRFQSAKRDASRKALQAAKRGDMEKVAEYLNLELMHHLTIRECIRARDLRAKMEKQYSTRALLSALEAKEHTPKVEDSYAEAVKAVATFVGLTGSRRLRPQVNDEIIPFPTYEPGSNVAEFLPDIAGTVEPWLLNKVYPDGYQDWRDFTVDQLREVDRVLSMLLTQGRGELSALREVGAANLEELVVKSITPMTRRESKPKQKDDRSAWGRALNKINRFMISITIPENWFMAMDGNPTISGKEAGINQRLFWKMRDCQLVKDALYKDMIEKLQPHFDMLAQAKKDIEARFGSDRFLLPGVAVPEIMKKGRGYQTWDADTLIAMMLQMGNDASFYRLTGIIKGQGKADVRENCFNFTEQELSTIAQLFTADQWRAMQGIWDGIGSLYDQLDAVTFHITNRHVVKEKAMPITVTTADGEVLALKGGYFPLVNDPMLSDRAAQLGEGSNIEDAIHSGVMDNVHQSTRPAAGMIKERARDEDGNPVVRLPQLLRTDILIKHLDAATHYISHAETILELDRMTRNEEWRGMYTDRFGADQYRAVRNWIQNLARPTRMDNSAGAQFMEKMRSLATVNALGLRFKTGVKQRLGYAQAINFMTDSSRTGRSGWAYMKAGWREMGFMGNLLGRNKEKVEFVNGLSDYMRARQGGHDRELRAQMEKISPLKTEITIPGINRTVSKRAIYDGMFAWIQANDTAAAYAAWLGGYKQALAGDANFDLTGMTEEEIQKEAVRYADSVAATQASSFAADLTEMQRDTGLLRFLAMFMSGNVRQGSRIMQYLDARTLGDKTGGDIAWLAFREFVAPSLAWIFMGAALKGMLGDDDDDLLTDAAWEVAETSIAPFPLVREVTSAIRYGSSGNVPAVAKPLESIVKGGRAPGRLLGGEYGKGLADIADAVGFAFGVPIMNPIRESRPLTDAIGITEPKKKGSK